MESGQKYHKDSVGMINYKAAETGNDYAEGGFALTAICLMKYTKNGMSQYFLVSILNQPDDLCKKNQ